MNLGTAMREEANWGITENGADALVSTGSALLDLYSSFGNYRNDKSATKTADFDAAFAESPLDATKILFYGRDARCGIGERQTFKDILAHMGNVCPEVVEKNLPIVGLFGRYDDLYALVGTKAENAMWTYMKEQFDADVANMKADKPVSLLAKWIKTPDAANENTAKLGKLTAKKLGYARNKRAEYQRTLKQLRKYIGIVEPLVYTGQFDMIDYSKMPGKAMLKYKNLIMEKDGVRYAEYLDKVNKGEAKINTSVVTPYDIVSKYLEKGGTHYSGLNLNYDESLETMWKNLPDYCSDAVKKNNLVVCDTSGSMFGDNAINVALSLAIYAAEHNVGQFKDMFITFSDYPKIQELKGSTLAQRISNLSRAEWGMSTNIESVMDLILRYAIQYKIPSNEMPSSITIVSDMQFNTCVRDNGRQTYIQTFKDKFKANGYELPTVIFWNVRSSKSVFHAGLNERGVQLASGCSATVFSTVVESMNITPYESMMKVINNPRYDVVQV